MFNSLQFAQMMIKNNQGNLPNTPWAQAAIQAIMNGDAQAGQNLAQNLCNNMGVNPEQMKNEAKKRFNLPF